MSITIGKKIFSIAAMVLVLMAAVTLYSIRLTAGISADLETITTKHMPLAESISQINLHMLEKGLLLQRLFVLTNEEYQSTSVQQNKKRFETLSNRIEAEFKAIEELFTSAGRVSSLKSNITAIRQNYTRYRGHGLVLLKLREQDDEAGFIKALPTLNNNQDAVDHEIIMVRNRIEDLSNQAVIHADKEEQNLLAVNSVLTVLAFIMGAGLAALISRLLVQSIQNLVNGTKTLEASDLDVEVAVTSKDEIGALTNSFNSMVGELRLKERIKETFGKYMDPRIVGNLLDHPEFTEPGGERREMSVLFVDLKGFTSISEKLAPNDLVNMVNNYFTHMTKAISDNKGVVDKYMGDAVMAYWGEPFCEPGEHAELACKAALAALEHLEDFRADVAKELGAEADGLDIDLRIGVSSGDMIVGTVGSTAQKNFTVMGDPVNLGSRLEGASKAYGTHILISDRTKELAGDTITTREIDLIRVKGKVEPTRIFELLSEPTSNADGFKSGLAAYRSQNWDMARGAFNQFLGTNPTDPASQVYLERITHLQANPPSPDWDGVWVFETK
ncbi:MAG: HAMP domain-containing protein [Rhodospirillaceae bacterium]|nr:HAMP domain-containing protein [Rhodospirillaceae bacterium]MBT7267502.1 HAMP domain-containing protein [Rhodospirillaceae bacterium]